MKEHDKHLGIWRHGISLARRFRFSFKLGALTVLLMVPIVVLSLSFVQRENNRLASLQAEIEAVVVVQQAMELMHLVQTHRAKTYALLSGDASAQSDLDKIPQALTRADEAVLMAIKSSSHSALEALWQPLSTRLQRLAADAAAAKGAANFALHTDLVRDLRQFMQAVARASGLHYESDKQTHLLIDVLMLGTVPFSEQMGQLLVMDAPDASLMSGLVLLKNSTADLRQINVLLQQMGQAAPSVEVAHETADQFLQVLGGNSAGGGGTPPADVKAYRAAGIRGADAMHEAQNRVLALLQEQLDRRASGYRWERNAMLLGGALVLLILIYLLSTFYSSFTIDMRRMSYAVKEIGSGNLRVQCTVRGHDELADLAELLRRMVANVSSMVATVGSDAALVAHVGRDLSARNHHLSVRTEQQANNLEQTSGSVRDLAATVRQNAQASSDVDHQAISVRDIAEAGTQSMLDSVASVEAIQTTAHRMNEIIGVIDVLAFQTNILALNAAVEAARAGEQGRGFAVVAKEVRTLAQSSAASAKEIRALIQASSAQVETSVALIRSAGEGMERIVSGIRSVSHSVSQISSASTEQSAGITEISSAMVSLDEITHQNTLMVDRAVELSNGLETKAHSLAIAIGNFKLLQGVANEAMDLIDRALAFHKECPTNTVFLQGLTEKSNNFFDRDMYVFVLDPTGTYRAFGGNPAKVGTRVQDIPGVNGQGLLDDIMAQATVAPGWVEYDIANPATGVVQAKMSYVSALQGPDGFAIGCGVYKQLVPG